MFVELVNIAANAVIAQQAAAARLLMASQALAECREQNNPYLPGNSLFGPTRAQMWGPDPCEQQEQDLASATADHQASVQLAQKSSAPTPQDIQSAPQPQLSSTWSTEYDPSIPLTEFLVPSPALMSEWSPTSLQEVLDMLAIEMEDISSGSSTSSEVQEAMEVVQENMMCFLLWDPWDIPPKKRKRYRFQPKNASWIGKWVPE
ncbi:NP [turkey parvovirus 2]|uniref:NP n=1 Tax=turkey parvovirus 2 TaxID=2848321 RepID=W0GDF8_9VIRU|nr:NP [turkey parvovirus 2]AHF54688.1 NP [turkey parvovirus 2]